MPNYARHNSELFARTDLIINLIFDKLIESCDGGISDIIVERGMNPVKFVLSRLVLENNTKNTVCYFPIFQNNTYLIDQRNIELCI